MSTTAHTLEECICRTIPARSARLLVTIISLSRRSVHQQLPHTVDKLLPNELVENLCVKISDVGDGLVDGGKKRKKMATQQELIGMEIKKISGSTALLLP